MDTALPARNLIVPLKGDAHAASNWDEAHSVGALFLECGQVGRATRDLKRRKAQRKFVRLREILAKGDDQSWLRLIWAVNMLQSGFVADASRYLNYPTNAATSAPDSELAIHEWELETIVSMLLSTPKWKRRFVERRDSYRTDLFDTMAHLINLLRGGEDFEAGSYLNDGNIMLEMSRIAHRQFGWQRGFATSERLYRYVYVYGQGQCAEYFERTNGLTLSDFLKVGFYLSAQLHKQPWAKPVAVEALDISIALIERAMPHFALELSAMRVAADDLVAKLGGTGMRRVAYLPSILRRYPIVLDRKAGVHIAPLPQLIVFRMTAGLYYDIAQGPQHLMTEANTRFEEYVRRLVAAYFPRFMALPSQAYGTRKAPLHSPDVLILDSNEVVVVIECKATKLTYDAQFADDPMNAAKGAYTQLVKGIAQLWRFFSHARLGRYRGPTVSERAHGVLLTLDSWMQMDAERRREAIEAARLLVADERDVLDVDMRPITFCSMQDLADVMIVSTDDQFLSTLESAETEQYQGWNLREIRRQAGQEVGRPFPFDVAELLPWWERLRGGAPTRS